VFSGSQKDNLWCGLEGHVVSKLVRKIVTRHRSCARSTDRIVWRPPWGCIKGDSQPQFEFDEVLVFSVRLLAITVGFPEFSPFVWSFFELLSLLRKDEDNAI